MNTTSTIIGSLTLLGSTPLYDVAGTMAAKALYDLIAEPWRLPPLSDAAQEVPLAT